MGHYWHGEGLKTTDLENAFVESASGHSGKVSPASGHSGKVSPTWQVRLGDVLSVFVGQFLEAPQATAEAHGDICINTII